MDTIKTNKGEKPLAELNAAVLAGEYRTYLARVQHANGHPIYEVTYRPPASMPGTGPIPFNLHILPMFRTIEEASRHALLMRARGLPLYTHPNKVPSQ